MLKTARRDEQGQHVELEQVELMEPAGATLRPASGPIDDMGAHESWWKQGLTALALCLCFLMTLVIGAAIGSRMAAEESSARPKNIIFMVSDGFGPSGVTFARMWKNRDLWKTNKPVPRDGEGDYPENFPPAQRGFAQQNLHLDSIVSGHCHTESASSFVTDSAAGATAYSCGLKSYNYAIAVDVQGKPCATLLEAAKASGMSVGIATTSSVTDATPASFATHATVRQFQDNIAEQFATNRNVDVLFGGGRGYFQHRNDTRDLTAEMQSTARGRAYRYVTNRDAMLSTSTTPVLGLFGKHHLDYEIDRQHESPVLTPSVKDMAVKAVQLLDARAGNKGFFLLIEGAKIDKAAHPNDAATMLREILAYDEAVGAMIDFARQDGETLIVSTSDHETGGLTLGRGVETPAVGSTVAEASLHERSFAAEDENRMSYKYQWYPDQLSGVTMSGRRMVDTAMAACGDPHKEAITCDSASCVAVQGCLVGKLAEVYQQQTGFTLTLSERALIESTVTMKALQVYEKLDFKFTYAYQRALNSITSARAHVGWTTWSHTGVDVNLYSYGPGSDRIRGSLENSEVGGRLEGMMGWDLAGMSLRLKEPPRGWKAHAGKGIHPT